jgi:hypothetical protein
VSLLGDGVKHQYKISILQMVRPDLIGYLAPIQIYTIYLAGSTD